MSFQVIETKSIPESERVTTDRADYTQDIVTNVNVEVQAERLARIVKTSSALITSGAANAYNTDWIGVGDFNKFIGTLFCNQDCTIYLEQSTDGENLDGQITQAYTGEAYDGVFSLELSSPYVRLRVVADADTTTFRVWSRLSMGA